MGGRESELLELCWDDLGLDAPTVTFPHHVTRRGERMPLNTEESKAHAAAAALDCAKRSTGQHSPSTRPIDLAGACLECGGAIDPDALRREQLDDAERDAQDYVDAPGGGDFVDPSVITLNSAAVAMAMLDFQLAATGMFPCECGSGSGCTTRPSVNSGPGRPVRGLVAGGAIATRAVAPLVGETTTCFRCGPACAAAGSARSARAAQPATAAAVTSASALAGGGLARREPADAHLRARFGQRYELVEH